MDTELIELLGEELAGAVAISDVTKKDEVLAKLKALQTPSKLNEILENAKFSGLKTEIDNLVNSKIGATRTKWEQEQAEKLKKTNKVEEKTPQTAGEETNKLLLEAVQEMQKQILELKAGKTVESLEKTKLELMKTNNVDLEFAEMFEINEKTTPEILEQKIKTFATKIGAKLQNSLDSSKQTAFGGVTTTPVGKMPASVKSNIEKYKVAKKQ